MTLDEAIRHCEEVAEEKECIAHSLTKDGWQEHFNNLTQEKEAEYKNVREEMANGCLECAEEYRQLAEWLRELQRYRFEISECKAILDNPTPDVTENDKKRAMYVLQTFPDVRGDEEGSDSK